LDKKTIDTSCRFIPTAVDGVFSPSAMHSKHQKPNDCVVSSTPDVMVNAPLVGTFGMPRPSQSKQ
jgi:hypothetical protein